MAGQCRHQRSTDIGHWVFGPDYPYHVGYGNYTHPFVQGCIAVLDRVFDWAEKLDLRVVLDLHAALGCQNGFDNAGIRDVCEWHTQGVLERPALHAIEV